MLDPDEETLEGRHLIEPEDAGRGAHHRHATDLSGRALGDQNLFGEDHEIDLDAVRRGGAGDRAFDHLDALGAGLQSETGNADRHVEAGHEEPQPCQGLVVA